jgi:hypothetical protein
MGINHLQLSPELIAALYPETLVAGNDPVTVKKTIRTAKPVPEPPAAYPFLGKNIRSICFLAHYPEGEFLPEVQLDFLQKILAVCKYSLDDIALVNTAHQPFDLAALRVQFQPRIIFLWGILPASVGLKPGMPDFSISLLDGISVIPVLRPALMSGDSPEGKEFKQRLWICLKKLFAL